MVGAYLACWSEGRDRRGRYEKQEKEVVGSRKVGCWGWGKRGDPKRPIVE